MKPEQHKQLMDKLNRLEGLLNGESDSGEQLKTAAGARDRSSADRAIMERLKGAEPKYSEVDYPETEGDPIQKKRDREFITWTRK